MEAKKRKPMKPKLERINAMKNIDYKASAATATFEDVSPKLRSRSLDLPPLNRQTSFRLKGIDGEFEDILRNLGLSGPEDFAIPTAAWEALKARSASEITSRNRNSLSDIVEDEVSVEVGTRVGVKNDIELKGGNFRANGEGKDRKVSVSSDSRALGPIKDGGGGIRGVRPPVLTPPPVVLRPMVDNVSSTWDLLKSFAPEYDGVVNSPIFDGANSSSGEEEVRGIEESEEVVREIDTRGERNRLSDSSSSTFHDDDSDVGYRGSAMVDDAVYNISPDGSFRRTFTSWQKGEVLGKGSFGTVYEGFTDDGFFFAVKEVSLLDQDSQGQQSISQLQQEILLLSQFEHENIVQYLGTDKDKSTLYIFLELVTKGSLASLYQKYRLRDSQVSSYTRQILSGLKYLHDRDVVHRDIKCANILVDANGYVKLADFGLAKATKLNDVKSSKGSPYWMAPEVVNLRSRGYGLAADIWSLGCTVLEMLTQRPPYSDLEGMQALFRIGRGEPPDVPDSLSKDARDFILKCLQVNPSKRPTAAQLLDHPFVKRPILPPLSPASPHVNNLQL